MAETIVKVYKETSSIINQCDIFKNVEFIEYVKEVDSVIEVSKIIFPKVIVLTQACDLLQDHNARKRNESDELANQDNFLISVIVAPLYNFEDFRLGEHLSQIGLNMQNMGRRSKSKCGNIIQNEDKRYHYLNFDKNVPITECVIDFKHYFTVNINYLDSVYKEQYICSIDSLYRELISQRFSNFLSRIGLPDPAEM